MHTPPPRDGCTCTPLSMLSCHPASLAVLFLQCNSPAPSKVTPLRGSSLHCAGGEESLASSRGVLEPSGVLSGLVIPARLSNGRTRQEAVLVYTKALETGRRLRLKLVSPSPALS